MARILVVTSMYPPHHYGGYELQCRDVVERWRAAGHTVEVLTSDHRLAGVDAQGTDDGAPVRRVLRWYWRDHEIERPRWRERIDLERHNHAELARAVEEVRPDVVSLWHLGAMSLSLVGALVDRGIPLVFVVLDDWLDYGPKVDAWLRPFTTLPGRLVAPVVARVTGLRTALPDLGTSGAFCFISEATRAHAERHTRWAYPNSAVVPSGIDTSLFRPGARDRSEWRWRLYLPGRLDPRKGIETAIRALARLPGEATLTVDGRGDGAHAAHLDELSRTLGVGGRVSFTCSPRAELPTRYRDADACLFPPTWPEPFGLVPLEAMACGTPVVATGTGGSGEYLADGTNCLLFPPHDDAALADAVTRLATDPSLRSRLVAGGLATAGRYSVDATAERLEAVHLSAAAERARSS